MNARIGRGLAAAGVLLGVMCGAACGSDSSGGSNGTTGDGGSVSTDQAEVIRQQVLSAVAEDPRFAGETPLTHDDYQALADKIAKVPGVRASTYVGDGLGGIRIAVDGGGVFEWRHIDDDNIQHSPAMPDNFDFGTLSDPTNNAGFKAPEVVSGPRASGTFATHFPVATISPDPAYKADDAVACPKEGSIAIVDFYYTEVKHKDLLYNNEFDIDGMELWDRLKAMGEAAGFTVDIFHDDEVNASNLNTVLSKYTYVLVNGHGSMPGPVNTDRTHEALVTFVTPEKYDAKKHVEDGKTYDEAWKAGFMNRSVKEDQVRWTPRLIQAVYKPQVSQHWLISTCFSMLPTTLGFLKGENGWTWRQEANTDFYNFGKALREKDVKTVFGYVFTGEVSTIARNHMKFFRRTFGGYFDKDRPPPPQTFWPTCMSSQTFFRLSATPQLALYANKLEGTSLYTMYTQADPVYLRQTCRGSPPNVHSLMQDFVLQVGTPATAFQTCWDEWWSKGMDPTGIQDALCSKGEYPTNTTDVQRAGCNVKIARKVTNAMLP